MTQSDQTGAEYVALFLAEHAVDCAFVLSGGMIVHLVDALVPRVRVVPMQHEQAAGFAAEGWARMVGHPTVAMATSGPGATNLITAIGSCWFDSIPVIFITGQVNTNELRGSRQIRQLGFQETDIVSVASPLVKWARRAESADELPQLLQTAWSTAVSGRPGPVLLDIPMDVQRQTVAAPTPEQSPQPATRGIGEFAARCQQALDDAARPLALIGGGVRSSGATAGVRRYLRAARLPAVHTLLGADVLPSDEPLRVGLIGTYGNRWANQALAQSDCVLVLGSRLDIRQTGADVASFIAGKSVWQVDIDPAEVGARVPVPKQQACLAGVTDFLASAAQPSPLDTDAWLTHLHSMRQTWPAAAEQTKLRGIHPTTLMTEISAASGAAAAYITDVGQHQMWAVQSLELTSEQRLLTSGGMGAMGFALPAAIGATLAAQAPVVLVAGDGGFQLNIQELQTVAHLGLPVKMVIVNNGRHGMVAQFQDAYLQGRLHASTWGYSRPDFASVARAYGILAATVEHPEGLRDALRGMWDQPQEPYLLDVRIDPNAQALPKMSFGRPFGEMEPLKSLGSDS